MNRIGIDCRFAGSYSGLGSYTRGLTEALTRLDTERMYVLFVRSKDEAWLSVPRSRPNVTIVVADFAHYSFVEHFAFPTLVKKSMIDLLLAPHFNVPYFCPVPFVCTVHDLTLHQFPNDASLFKRLAYKIIFGRSVARAKGIVTISGATRDELTHRYPATLGKIFVIFPGVDSRLARASEETVASLRLKYGLQKPFFVYVGSDKEHKNIPVLVDAFRRASLSEFELVLVSGNSLSVGWQAKFRNPNGVRFLCSVPVEELPALYSAAAACVTATKAEGFCLPLIEAMACGTPVLATTIGPIPEVTGGLALLCDPDADSLAECMQIFAKTEMTAAHRSELAAFAKKYSWDASAERHRELLNALAEPKNVH